MNTKHIGVKKLQLADPVLHSTAFPEVFYMSPGNSNVSPNQTILCMIQQNIFGLLLGTNNNGLFGTKY